MTEYPNTPRRAPSARVMSRGDAILAAMRHERAGDALDHVDVYGPDFPGQHGFRIVARQDADTAEPRAFQVVLIAPAEAMKITTDADGDAHILVDLADVPLGSEINLFLNPARPGRAFGGFKQYVRALRAFFKKLSTAIAEGKIAAREVEEFRKTEGEA